MGEAKEKVRFLMIAWGVLTVTSLILLFINGKIARERDYLSERLAEKNALLSACQAEATRLEIQNGDLFDKITD